MGHVRVNAIPAHGIAGQSDMAGFPTRTRTRNPSRWSTTPSIGGFRQIDLGEANAIDAVSPRSYHGSSKEEMQPAMLDHSLVPISINVGRRCSDRVGWQRTRFGSVLMRQRVLTDAGT